jgi:predicted N-acetyltransferase YhbS
MKPLQIEPFQPSHAVGISELCSAEGWDSWGDAEAVCRALSAPGVQTLVALRDGEVVEAIQILADGEINWMIGTLIVAERERGAGIGRQLVAEAFARSGAKRLDLLTEDDGPGFYRQLSHREMFGFRLYPT